MTLGEPDASGRRRPVPEAGSEFEIEADMVVYAIGTNANASTQIRQHIDTATSQARDARAGIGGNSGNQTMTLIIRALAMGRITGLINNAGVVDVASRVEDMSWQRLERMMRINVLGSLACAREAVRRMSTAHGGSAFAPSAACRPRKDAGFRALATYTSGTHAHICIGQPAVELPSTRCP